MDEDKGTLETWRRDIDCDKGLSDEGMSCGHPVVLLGRVLVVLSWSRRCRPGVTVVESEYRGDRFHCRYTSGFVDDALLASGSSARLPLMSQKLVERPR